jgi:quercetin dioxygenase-like cupin family protein
MEAERVDFPADWTEEAPGVQARPREVAGTRWALVEYAGGAGRPEWCTDGHRGYVLSGRIEYEFDDGGEPLRLSEGDGVVLPAGRGHRGHNPGDAPARLFLIDD